MSETPNSKPPTSTIAGPDGRLPWNDTSSPATEEIKARTIASTIDPDAARPQQRAAAAGKTFGPTAKQGAKGLEARH
jgi:hypothetical protein